MEKMCWQRTIFATKVENHGKLRKRPSHWTPHPRTTEGRQAQRRLAGARNPLHPQQPLQNLQQAITRCRFDPENFQSHEFQFLPILHGRIQTKFGDAHRRRMIFSNRSAPNCFFCIFAATTNKSKQNGTHQLAKRETNAK